MFDIISHRSSLFLVTTLIVSLLSACSGAGDAVVAPDGSQLADSAQDSSGVTPTDATVTELDGVDPSDVTSQSDVIEPDAPDNDVSAALDALVVDTSVPCATTAECDTTSYCSAGHCVPGCDSDLQCLSQGSGFRCRNNLCQLPCAGARHACGAVCVQDFDCGSQCGCPTIAGVQLSCDGQRCLVGCAADQKACHGQCISANLPCRSDIALSVTSAGAIYVSHDGVARRWDLDDVTPLELEQGLLGALSAGSGLLQVVRSDGFECRLRLDRKVYCFGPHNFNGELGIGRTDPDNEKVSYGFVLGLPADIVQITSGAFHACALSAGGALYCWGSNDNQQLVEDLFVGDQSSALLIEQVKDVRRVVAGGRHTCALTNAGEVYCWGDNEDGQRGGWLPSGRVVLGGTATSLAAGTSHTCAVYGEGLVACWGSNYFWQLGYEKTEPTETQPTPVVVSGLPPIKSVWAGGNGTCAVSTENEIYCWGQTQAPFLWASADSVSAVAMDYGVRCMINDSLIYCRALLDGNWHGFNGTL
ncbi:MAG: hypothetical protein KC609_17605 [Myxococcales bacterium]|nr:hypothetical protein [Myxococcales bacterium]